MTAAPPDREAPGGRRFPPSRRIRTSKEIRGLFRRGRRRTTADFDVFLASSPHPHARIGLVVPKHRHTAVERNRLKRRMREVGRLTVLPALDRHERALDMLVRARPGAYGLTYEEIRSQLGRITETICSRPSL